jgi:hypothetical protein
MVDYSKFDNIDSGSDEEPDVRPHQAAASASHASIELKAAPALQKLQVAKKGREGRIRFEHEGREVYEWEQASIQRQPLLLFAVYVYRCAMLTNAFPAAVFCITVSRGGQYIHQATSSSHQLYD